MAEKQYLQVASSALYETCKQEKGCNKEFNWHEVLDDFFFCISPPLLYFAHAMHERKDFRFGDL